MNTRLVIVLWLVVIMALAAAGLVVEGLGEAVLAGVLLVVPSLLICRRIERKVGVPLVMVFLLAVLARWVVAAAVQIFVYRSRPGLFAPDEFAYDRSGWWYCQFLQGRIPDPWEGGAIGAIIRLIGGCYYVFGYKILVPKFVIGVLGAWTATLTALIAVKSLSKRVAYRAGLLTALFPSLVLWSSLLIKDTDTLFAAELSLLGFLQMRERFSIGSFLVFLSGLIIMQFDRPYEVIFVAMTVTASMVVQRGRRPVRNLTLLTLLTLVAVFVIKRSGADTQALGENSGVLDRILTIRAGYSGVGIGSAINTSIVDTSTSAGLVLWAPIGLIYFFFAPFPFTGGSAIALATSPEMLLFYYLLPSLWRGLRTEIGRRHRLFVPLLLYLLFSSIGWSIAITNIGTIYRYRSQVLFVLLILIAADQVRRRELREPARS